MCLDILCVFYVKCFVYIDLKLKQTLFADTNAHIFLELFFKIHLFYSASTCVRFENVETNSMKGFNQKG